MTVKILETENDNDMREEMEKMSWMSILKCWKPELI